MKCNCAASRPFLVQLALLDSRWFGAAARLIWRHLGVSEQYQDFWGCPGKAESLLVALESSPRRGIYANAVRSLSIVCKEHGRSEDLDALHKRLTPIVPDFRNLQNFELEHSAKVNWVVTDRFLEATRGLPIILVRLKQINLGAQVLSRCLKSWSDLRYLEISTDLAEGDFAISLAQSMPDRALQHLALEGHTVRLSADSWTILLPKLVGLKSLNLGDVTGLAETRELFAAATAETEILEIRGGPDDGFHQIMEGFRSTSLKKLCLAELQLRSADTESLVALLTNNPNLAHLGLCEMPLMELVVFMAMVEALPTSLTSLELDETMLAPLLGDLLPFVPNLEHLTLRNDGLPSDALFSMTELYDLEYLELTLVYIEDVDEFTELLRESWPELRTLCVRGVQFDASWADDVRKWRQGLDIVVGY